MCPANSFYFLHHFDIMKLIFILAFLLNNFLIIRSCERSLEVRGVEDYCWTKNVEIIDRLSYTGKSFMNFAKKKLGMEVENDNEPQKCDYYNCILQELKMLNGDKYPCHEKITTWIKNNVIYNKATVLLSRVDYCSDLLSKSIDANIFFTTDKEEMESTTGDDDDGKGKPSILQGKCDIVAEYMRCISVVEKNETCPVFQYP